MKFSLKRIASVLLFSGLTAIASVTAFPPVNAFAKVQAIELNADQVAAIQRINAYLNSYQSLRGDFLQTSPKGRSTRGVMNIQKPGKLRFEYEAPKKQIFTIIPSLGVKYLFL